VISDKSNSITEFFFKVGFPSPLPAIAPMIKMKKKKIKQNKNIPTIRN